QQIGAEDAGFDVQEIQRMLQRREETLAVWGRAADEEDIEFAVHRREPRRQRAVSPQRLRGERRGRKTAQATADPPQQRCAGFVVVEDVVERMRLDAEKRLEPVEAVEGGVQAPVDHFRERLTRPIYLSAAQPVEQAGREKFTTEEDIVVGVEIDD